MPTHALKYLSICSGIEAATAAWHPLGWQPAGFSEIDPFVRAVLAHHYPQVPLHGDFTALKENDYAAIDLLVGGTPCQSFSVAGLRKGLADDRGNLALEFIRLAEKSRARWVVWENVPGVLSIDGGRAFGTFLGGLAECGYGFAYRILDAQYFGVPQRRRRVFVVGYLGDWRPAAAVLFERESLRRDITPRRQARESIAGTLKGGTGSRGYPDPSDGDGGGLVAPTLDARSGRSGENSFATSGGLIAHSLRGQPNCSHREDAETLVAHTLRADGFDASEDGTGRGVPLLAFGGGNTSGSIDVAAGLNAKSTQRQDFDTETLIAFSAKDYGNDAVQDIAPTLRAMPHAGSHQNGGGQLAVAIPLQEVGKRTGVSTDDASIGSGIGEDGDAMFTLQAAAQHAVAFNVTFCDANGRRKDRPDGGLYVNETDQAKTVTSGGDLSTYVAFAQNCRDDVRLLNGDGDLAGALPAQPGMKQQTFVAGCFKPGQSAASRSIGYEEDIAPSLEGGGGGNNKPALAQGMAVRRLTPRECERLQGFADDYTLVPFRGKPAADGNRYKALGNSMAVPVMRWLGERIAMIDGMLQK
jgi:DNA (cytosine-5)-methyltransferase 1